MFTGGEPTYHPDFEDIVLNKPDHIKLALISNGSRPYSFWERIGGQISYLILTFHPEFAKIDRFVDVARLMMVDKKCEGRINLIMHPEHWDYCIEAYNKLMEAGVTVSAKPLMDSFGDGNKAKVSSTYTQDELDWIAERNKEDGDKFIEYLDKDRNVLYETNAAEMLARGDTNFKGWECHATTQTLTISPDGRAFSMTCGQGFLVGGIYTGFKLPTESVICRQNSCWCHYDIAATKNRVIPIIPQ
jgi:MoaA/NifB/PqqE/SkfB family radical SAM enzyme